MPIANLASPHRLGHNVPQGHEQPVSVYSSGLEPLLASLARFEGLHLEYEAAKSKTTTNARPIVNLSFPNPLPCGHQFGTITALTIQHRYSADTIIPISQDYHRGKSSFSSTLASSMMRNLYARPLTAVLPFTNLAMPHRSGRGPLDGRDEKQHHEERLELSLAFAQGSKGYSGT